MTEEKQLIGIDFVGRNNEIGSMLGCAVMVKKSLFRDYGFLNIKQGPENATVKDLNKIVELTKRGVTHYTLIEILPETIDKDNIEDLEIKSTIMLLNGIFRFWQHDITIKTCLSREKFMALWVKFIPLNWKNNKDINPANWELEPQIDTRIIGLAGMYAQYELNIRLNDIKSVWGDINKSKEFIQSHPDCPHIRKSSKSFKELFPIINEWDKLKNVEENQNGNN